MLNDSSDFQHILEAKMVVNILKNSMQKDWIGELTVWDGINFEIEFRLDDKR
jgi:hypothetical protein